MGGMDVDLLPCTSSTTVTATTQLAVTHRAASHLYSAENVWEFGQEQRQSELVSIFWRNVHRPVAYHNFCLVFVNL
jgi:hypothetical protein